MLAGIQQGRWRANDRLPTEVELAEKFRVSRFTVKKALGELAEEGLVYRIQGRGSYIAQVAEAPDRLDADAEDAEPAALRTILLLAPQFRGSLAGNVLEGAEEALSEAGYRLLLRSSRNDRATERRALLEGVRAGVRGVIIFPVDGESYNEDVLRLTLNKFPVVVIDRYLRGVETNCVCSDNAEGAYDAAKHLIDLGHERIAFVSVHGKPTTSLEDRRDGFDRALSERGLPTGAKLMHYDSENEKEPPAPAEDSHPTFDSSTARIRDFLAANPDVTAVFAANSVAGAAVLQAASPLDLAVPERLSVAHFDDVEQPWLLRVAPTCVAQQEKALGFEAARLLLSVIDDPLQERRRVVLPTRLVVRDSTAPPRSRG
jgi:DNA-binding LacI/PurR family transcriptional regulator